MSFIVAVILLAITTAVACAIPGTFLVLRGQSMLVDGISHAVLPGIVLGAIISGSAHSPVMVLIATLCGLLVVVGANKLEQTGLLTGDANQGVIFPTLFAFGVLLLSTQLSGVHICTNTVLVGDLNLMALESERLVWAGFDFGPRMMWALLAVTAVNVTFMAVAYRVLQVSTFDRDFAIVSGMPVKRIDAIFMVLLTLTVVTAFHVAGAILVIALMVVPAATATLISRRLNGVLASSLIIAVVSAVVGFLAAWVADVPTTPMMALFGGLIFCGVLILDLVRRGAWSRDRYRTDYEKTAKSRGLMVVTSATTKKIDANRLSA